MKHGLIKRTLSVFLIIGLIVCVFSGCAAPENETETTKNSSTSASSENTSTSAAVSTTSSAENTTAEAKTGIGDTTTAIKITLSDSAHTSSSSVVKISGKTITISHEGTYTVSGTAQDAEIIINAAKEDKVNLILNGASFTTPQVRRFMPRSATS